MDKIFDILEQRINLYLENIKLVTNQTDDILDFCKIPLLTKNFHITKKQSKKLEKIKTNIKHFQQELSSIEYKL